MVLQVSICVDEVLVFLDPSNGQIRYAIISAIVVQRRRRPVCLLLTQELLTRKDDFESRCNYSPIIRKHHRKVRQLSIVTVEAKLFVCSLRVSAFVLSDLFDRRMDCYEDLSSERVVEWLVCTFAGEDAVADRCARLLQARSV
jgi:hypothetical protein